MYFDRRLWALTEGVRRSHRRHRPRRTGRRGGRHRAAGAARLAARPRAGRRFAGVADAGAIVLTAAALVGRSALDYARTMVAHHTAARVQQRLRQTLYEHVGALGPAHFVRDAHRRGDALAGRGRAAARGLLRPVPAAALRRRAHAGADLRLRGVPRPARRAGAPGRGARDAAGADAVAPLGQQGQPRPQPRLRARSAPTSSTPCRDWPRSRPSARAATRARRLEERAHALFKSTMWVLGTNTLARGITDTGIAVGAAAALALGAWRVERRRHVAAGAARHPHARRRGVPAAARAAHRCCTRGCSGLAAARGIFALLDARAGGDATAPAGPEPRDAGVAFEDVTFAYPGGRRARARRPQLRGAAGRAGRHRGRRAAPASRPSPGCCCASTIPSAAASPSAGATCAS